MTNLTVTLAVVSGIALLALTGLAGKSLATDASPNKAAGHPAARPGVVKTDAEWRKSLTAQQYHVLREKGTEQAFTGALVNNHAAGVYACAGCGQKLFDSKTKFESGTGWPSFYQPIKAGAVTNHEDRMFGMVRTEVTCSNCGGHLGHVFDDGPKPTGRRYCMNSAALTFLPAKK